MMFGAMLSRSKAALASLAMAPTTLRASAVLALTRYLRTPYVAKVARMPTMATTTINSMSVKPAVPFDFRCALRDCLQLPMGRIVDSKYNDAPPESGRGVASSRYVVERVAPRILKDRIIPRDSSP